MPSKILGMQSSFSATTSMLITVEAAAFAYSVYRRWGYRCHYPIAVIVENLEAADEISERLGIFGKNTLSMNISPTVFIKTLKGYHDDLCSFSFSRGRYSADNLENLLSTTMGGGYEDWEMNTLPLVMFEKIIPKEYKGKFSFVIEVRQNDLDELKRWERADFLDRLKIYTLTHTQITVHELAKQSVHFWEGKDSRFWTAVIKMLELFFEHDTESGAEQLRDFLCIALQRAYNMVDSYDWDCQIPALFREMFDQSISEICKFQPMSNVMEISEQKTQETVLYDDENYYVPELLFSKICKPLNDLCTVNQIKDALARDGILCTQGQGRIYKTIKKNVGILNTPLRFVWLKREALEEGTMEMSFVDLYLIREAKRNDK